MCLKVKTVPDVNEKTAYIYSNFVVMDHTLWDVELKFCLSSTDDPGSQSNAPSGGNREETRKAPCQVCVKIPDGIIDQMISDLQKHKQQIQDYKNSNRDL